MNKIFTQSSKKLLKGYTLLEMVITVALVALIAGGVLAALNPYKQLLKADNTKRKTELSSLKRVLEDYYNDNSHYPSASELCYDTVSTSRTDSQGNSACSCHVCGFKPGSPKLTSYINTLPCDPKSNSGKNYLYDIDCSNNGNNPAWYRMYSYLGSQDSEGTTIRCQNSTSVGLCGPQTDANYGYGINSSNIKLE